MYRYLILYILQITSYYFIIGFLTCSRHLNQTGVITKLDSIITIIIVFKNANPDKKVSINSIKLQHVNIRQYVHYCLGWWRLKFVYRRTVLLCKLPNVCHSIFYMWITELYLLFIFIFLRQQRSGEKCISPRRACLGCVFDTITNNNRKVLEPFYLLPTRL